MKHFKLFTQIGYLFDVAPKKAVALLLYECSSISMVYVYGTI
jgi:hypothetical protein